MAGPRHGAAFPSAARALMPATLQILAERHPRLRVTMTQREPEAVRDAGHPSA